MSPMRDHPFKASCARVRTEHGDRLLGTGYLISTDHVLTCEHVVAEAGEGNRVSVDFLTFDEEISLSATVTKTDPATDCALLTLATPVTGLKPLQLAEGCDFLAPWDSYGFPELTGGNGSSLAGTVSDPKTKYKGTPSIELHCEDLSGNAPRPGGFSGSPVVVNGIVVGHIREYLLDPVDQNRAAWKKLWATPCSSVIPLIDHLHIRPSLTAPQPGSLAFADNLEQLGRLQQQWTSGGPLQSDSALALAESFISLDKPEQALHILSSAPAGSRATQLRALALGRMGQNDEAIRLLEVLRDQGTADKETLKETLGLLGGRYKKKYDKTGDKKFLGAAYKAYQEAFDKTRDSYPGINAAALALRLKEPEKSIEYAQKVLAALESAPTDRMDNWKLATMGEAHLLLRNLEAAKSWYQKAVDKRPSAQADIAVMRQQARQNLMNLGLDPALLDPILELPRIAAFTGHMVDVPGRKPERFPERKVWLVQEAIRDKLRLHNIGYGFCSAARGSDVLFLEELLARDGHAEVFLPFPVDDFARTSVGFGWDGRYKTVLHDDRVTLKILAETLPPEDKQPEAYELCNATIHKAAIEKAKSLGEKPILLTVWNGKPGDGKGGTADSVRAWEQRGYQVVPIDISRLEVV